MDSIEEHKFDNGQTIDQVADSLSGDLGLGESGDDSSRTASPEVEPETPAEPPAGTTDEPTEQPATIVAKAPPKTWAPETHELWTKLDPKTQEVIEKREEDFYKGIEGYKTQATFGKQIQEAFAPYQAMLTASGITDYAQATKGFLNAHYRLTDRDVGKRTEYFAGLAKVYGIDINSLAKPADPNQPAPDPRLSALENQIQQLTGHLTQQQQTQVAAQKAAVEKEIDAFASDPAHPYFNEVTKEMSLLLADPTVSLKDAYERAVRANPITWAKEQTRIQTETAEKLRKEAEERALKAKRAKGTTVKGRESTREPAELIGSIDDTLKETMSQINSRVE